MHRYDVLSSPQSIRLSASISKFSPHNHHPSPPHLEGIGKLWGETDVLIDKQNPNILPLFGELVEGCFDGGGFGFGVDDEEVFGGGGRGRYVLFLIFARGLVGGGKVVMGGVQRTPMPARSRPVTESWL